MHYYRKNVVHGEQFEVNQGLKPLSLKSCPELAAVVSGFKVFTNRCVAFRP
ncbi:hypothetical protein SynBIOSE41_03526 [Synechococcus sp. BIOS-E4-1]|nr:hypothetical protein MITS9504_02615 [Synechococcus sp. MIT S9504]KZR89524.1 hypothetical protein MITS9509_02950 [Synechococcus sp. MIT S9509]QNI55997.1 hypothetical protein SynBIOSE41_03526 [Synechococcus sp. BIOS-E4-1]